MNEQAAREYSESLGQIFEGGYRQAAWADKEGIPKSLGMTLKEWVYQYLGGYVRMAVEERNAAINELAAEGTSKDGIARALGVSKDTVAAVLAGEEPQEYRKRYLPDTSGSASGVEDEEPDEDPRSASGPSEPAEPTVSQSELDASVNAALARDVIYAVRKATAELSKTPLMMRENPDWNDLSLREVEELKQDIERCIEHLKNLHKALSARKLEAVK